jgi:acyl carrier protein
MSTFKQVYQAIIDVILNVSDIEEEELSPASTFEEVDIDSIDYIELGFMVKKNFNLSIDGALFESRELTDIQQLCDYIIGNMPGTIKV